MVYMIKSIIKKLVIAAALLTIIFNVLMWFVVWIKAIVYVIKF